MSSLTATCPFPGRALAALALPAAMLVTLGTLAAIGTPPVMHGPEPRRRRQSATSGSPEVIIVNIIQATRRAQPSAQIRHKVMGRA